MSLQEKLSAFKAQFQSGKPPFEGVPPDVHALMQRATDELIASGAPERVVKAGAAPSFELKDEQGRLVRLADIVARGPAVVSFYRGAWCPYCNLDLQELELHAARIREAGATLLAITPQTAANSRRLVAQHKLSFPILSDPGNEVAERYGLRYRVPDYLLEVYRRLGVDLAVFNGDHSGTLPIPARYLVDRGGRILHAEASPDYTHRPEPEELLAALDQLRRDLVA